MKRPHFITTKLITLFALFCIVSLIPVMVFAQDSDPVLPPAEARNLRVLTLLQHDSPVAAVEFSPGGNFFLSGTVGGQLYIWQAGAGSQHQRGELLYTLDGYLPGVTVTAFDSDEKRLAASLGADGSRIELYDTATGAPVLVFEEHTQPLHSIRFFNEDTQLISYDFFGQVFIFDAQSGAIITQFEDILDFAIAPDDNRIVLTRSDGSLIFYAPDSGSEVSDVNAEFLRFSPGGRWLALWGDGLSVWDAQNRSEYFHVSDAQVDDVIWTPDGRFLITRSFANAEIRAINPAPELEIQTGDVVFSFPIFSDGGLRQITLSPDGQRVVTVDTRGTGRIWRIEAQGEARQIGALSTLVDDVAISPDNITLVGFRRDFRTRFWSAVTGELRGETELPESLIFSPDWKLLVSYTGTIVAWRGLPSEEMTFAFSPVGRPVGRTNLRPTPSEDLPRLRDLDSRDNLFVLARAGQWLLVVIEDGTQGWVNTNTLQIEVDDTVIENLPEVPVARTRQQNPDDDLPFFLMPEPAPVDAAEGLEGCDSIRTVVILDEQSVDGVNYFHIDCGTQRGWLPESDLEFPNSP